MRIKAFSTLALGLGLGLVGSQLAACSNSAEDCNATASCGTAGSSVVAGSAGKATGGGSGNDGGGSGAGSGSGGSQGASGNSGNAGEGGGGGSECQGDVADDAACWTTNELGVFVSSDTGNDATGNGTKEAPFASISKAIGAAAGKNVYVCLGVADAYAEKVTITNTAGDGVKIYGGFECTNWTHDVARYVTVESPENIALRIQELQQGAQIENVRFFAANGAGQNHSSYGAFITDSVGVVLRRVEITAGDGLKGADGEAGGTTMDGMAVGPEQNGEAALCDAPPDGVPGKWTAPACGSRGGNGGVGALDTSGGSGFSGIPNTNVTPANLANLGSGASDGNPGEDGDDGASGNGGTLGAAALALGGFEAGGYTPAHGNAGGTGFPGQGGGGGGASRGQNGCRGASGGAGGLGGCGGNFGMGGAGGGATVGLFSWRSGVTLEACEISSGTGGAGGNGGKGGNGGQGANGGSGGLGITGQGIASGGDGGDGGPGGNGGSGSGGTGGPSYAVAYSGTKPVYTAPDTTLTPGTGGAKGIGGQVLEAKAPDGSEGDAQAEFEIQ